MAPELQALILQSLLLLLASAFCSFSEAAIVALNDFKIQMVKKSHEKIAASLQKIVKNQPKYLSAIITANTIVNIGGSAYIGAQSMLIQSPSEHTNFITILTICMLCFAEIKPKIIAAQKPEMVAIYINYPIRFITWVLSPFVNMINGLLGNKPTESKMSIHEIEHYICSAKDVGIIKVEEARIMSNVVDLRTRTAKEFCFKDNIESVSVSSSNEQILNYIVNESEKRRIIVLNHEGHPIGVIKKEEILRDLCRAGNTGGFSLLNYIYSIPTVTEDCLLPKLAIKLNESKTHLAIVEDKESKMVGVISLSDIQGMIFE